ncbi:MAG: hypothetical protein HC884_14155 [Chloroflexaceae bacterium]|nr:hypothetical protein [Chloroflexaceae bacterium]
MFLPVSLIALLKQYASEQHYQPFTEVVQTVDWATRSPDEMLQVVDRFLHLGLNQAATELAQKAAPLHPQHKRAQRAATGGIAGPSRPMTG